MGRIALAAGLMAVILSASGAFALSDREYKEMLQTSPEYRRAEAELSTAWNRIRTIIKNRKEGMWPREMLDSQREWVASGRDEEAQALINRGMSRSEAYAKVTRARAKYLDSFVSYTPDEELIVH